MIPTFIQQVIGVVVRAAVVWLAGYVAAHGGAQYSEHQITTLVAEVVPVLAVIVWSIWTKYRGRQKLVVALATPASITEHEAEDAVKQGEAPSVLTAKDRVPQSPR